MKQLTAWLNKYGSWLLLFLLTGGFIWAYQSGKKTGGKLNYPNGGAGIPPGWNANTVIERIQNDFGVFDVTTNEQDILAALSPLTPDQRAAVNNTWVNEYGETILVSLRDHFSNPANLAIALNYFNIA